MIEQRSVDSEPIPIMQEISQTCIPFQKLADEADEDSPPSESPETQLAASLAEKRELVSSLPESEYPRNKLFLSLRMYVKKITKGNPEMILECDINGSVMTYTRKSKMCGRTRSTLFACSALTNSIQDSILGLFDSEPELMIGTKRRFETFVCELSVKNGNEVIRELPKIVFGSEAWYFVQEKLGPMLSDIAEENSI